jgi:hypothetical protein
MNEDAERIIALIARTSYRTALRIPDHKAISQQAWVWICKDIDVTQLCEKHEKWCREQERLMEKPLVSAL